MCIKCCSKKENYNLLQTGPLICSWWRPVDGQATDNNGYDTTVTTTQRRRLSSRRHAKHLNIICMWLSNVQNITEHSPQNIYSVLSPCIYRTQWKWHQQSVVKLSKRLFQTHSSERHQHIAFNSIRSTKGQTVKSPPTLPPINPPTIPPFHIIKLYLIQFFYAYIL